MKILAIETSCDETAAAIVEDGTKIISSALATSTAMHRKYGGIVPEVAAREQLRCIMPVIQEVLELYKKEGASMSQCITDEIDAIAVTTGPGLIGSLLVGVETAKTMAFVTGKPLIPVNHVLAHMYANFLESIQGSSSRIPSATEGARDNNNQIEFPAISLVVSGGHTELFLMKSASELTWLGGTVDDAAGEAFDKTARLLGFETGGGPAIQNAAKLFDGKKIVSLPRPLLHDDTLNFSFSGLKTAIIREWKKFPSPSDQTTAAFAYEVQESITDVLVAKTVRAVKQHSAQSILLSGGVAANIRLRKKFKEAILQAKLSAALFVPPIELCTDNAAYIAAYAYFRGKPVDWHDITAIPDLSVEA